MSHKISTVPLWLIPILALTLFPAGLSGQQTPAQNFSSHKSRVHNSATAQTVTGCLQKGDEAGGFVLAAEDGKTWELRSKTVKLAEHVGHKVKVTGTTVPESKAHEEMKEANEKKEAAGKEAADLKVSSLEMVSDSCN